MSTEEEMFGRQTGQVGVNSLLGSRGAKGDGREPWGVDQL